MEFKATSNFERFGLPLAVAGIAVLPLKLIFAYIAIIPLIVLWLLNTGPKVIEHLKATRWFSAPFLLFACAIAVSAFFGIDTARSLKGLPSLLFFFLFILVVRELAIKHTIFPFLYALAAGQSIAALHSVFRSAFPGMPRLFLGQVTESGQLAMTIMAVAGLAIFLKHQTYRPVEGEGQLGPAAGSHRTLHVYLLCLLNSAFLIAFGFRRQLDLPVPVWFLTLVAFLPLLAAAIQGVQLLSAAKRDKNGLYDALRFITLSVIFPLLIAALVVNLKRGPWAGVLVGSTLLLATFEKRLVVPVLILFFSVLFAVEPVRTRLFQSSQDFFIAGGRSVIWQIGAELATRYPLGVGYKNSSFLQKFSPQIPPELRHFHNNALNLLVETGWISLFIYAWWLFVLIRSAFRFPPKDPLKPIVLGLGCALISWQIAGVVEYNIGDSEVVLLAYALIGLLTAAVEERIPNNA